MSVAGSRKRPAPGASPLIQQQQPAPISINAASSHMSTDQYLQWHQQNVPNDTPTYPDPAANYNSNLYHGMNQSQSTPTPSSASKQLARRPGNQQMVPRATYNNVGNDAWPVISDDSLPQPSEQSWLNTNDDLEQKAQVARRETQAKRKQIPPFVQKLSSFLDESRNTELIRWSESGDSFIVVDEDEFAKTLIPELFKHNNYASFVRQLNMYGFHKKVGLSDNSMRASERKNKSPSEYYNPYFKRGRPNLLWLIQKPKNPQGKGGGKGGTRIKQEDGNLEDEGDDMFDVDTPAPPNPGAIENSPNLRNGRQPLMIGQGGGGLPRDELANVQRELHAVRQQQQLISNLLQQTREQHKQLYGQAAAFQSLHDRHESSINAILTFLATVYNRSLEGQGGPNFANMFAGAIPHDTQGQGNVVDVGDYGDQDPNATSQQPRHFRKQPLLLKAPPHSQNGRVSAGSPSSTVESPFQRPQSRLSVVQTPNYSYHVQNPAAHSPAIQELSEGQTPSNRSSQSPQVIADNELNEHIPEADIMSMINSTNASAGPFSTGSARMDFPEALSHLQTADGKSPLTPNQRQDVLQLMANESAATRPNENNNALAFSTPPNFPDIVAYNTTKDQLEFLGNSLKEQEQKVNGLSNILAPLSPSGSIPGIATDTPNYIGSDMLELDQIFNSGDYFNDASTSDLNFGNGNELADFTFDTLAAEDPSGGGGGGGGGGFNGGYDGRMTDGEDRVTETMNSSVSTSPAATVEDGFVIADETRSPGKKRRKG